jgi:biotin operon repressor
LAEIRVPPRPRLKQKEAPLPPQRPFAVLPARIAYDRNVSDGAIRTLVALTHHCNRAGITWISQAKLAQKLGISRTALTTSMARLRKAGYVEIVKKGFRGSHNNTLRVVYDPTVSAEDAAAIASNQEDCRTPDQLNEDSNMTPEEQKAKIARMLQGVIKPIGTTSQPARTYRMPADGETIATKRIKAGMKNRKLSTEHRSAQADVKKTLWDVVVGIGVKVKEEEKLYIEVLEETIPHDLCARLIAQVGERCQREGLPPPKLSVLVDAVSDLFAEYLQNAPGSPTAHDRGQG